MNFVEKYTGNTHFEYNFLSFSNILYFFVISLGLRTHITVEGRF